MALDFFNLHWKVGEIKMKYFKLTFLKFTVKGNMTKWKALEIGIMMCWLISSLFVLAMELILRGGSIVAKGVMTKEQMD